MNQATPAIRDLARLLLALEAAGGEHDAESAQVALRVFDKLRLRLSKLVGIAGFQALLSRSLAISKREVQWLQSVRVLSDATLDGFSETALQHPVQAVVEGSTALLAQLLGLLIVFIGEALTLCIVHDVWPDAQGDILNFSADETRHE